MYHNGKGVPQDYAETVGWWRLASEQGHAKAQSNLALMYGTGEGVSQDAQTAHMWANIAAENGSETAGANRDEAA